jgi:hypothetical protein
MPISQTGMRRLRNWRRRTWLLVAAVVVIVLVASVYDSAPSPPAAPGASSGIPFAIVSPAEGTRTAAISITVTGTGPAGATVTRDIPVAADDHATVGGDGRWQLAVDLSGGTNSLVFRLGDDRSTSMTLHVILDPTAQASAGPTEVGSPSRSSTPVVLTSPAVVASASAVPRAEHSASPSPGPSLGPTATRSPAPTPSATPRPSPTPASARLVFGTLKASANVCYGSQYQDAAGHLFNGATVALSLTVRNAGTVASEPIWLGVEWRDADVLLGAHLFAIGGKTIAGTSVRVGATVYLEAPVLTSGQSATLAWSVFFETLSQVDFRVTVREAPADAGVTVVSHPTLLTSDSQYATVNFC